MVLRILKQSLLILALQASVGWSQGGALAKLDIEQVNAVLDELVEAAFSLPEMKEIKDNLEVVDFSFDTEKTDLAKKIFYFQTDLRIFSPVWDKDKKTDFFVAVDGRPVESQGNPSADGFDYQLEVSAEVSPQSLKFLKFWIQRAAEEGPDDFAQEDLQKLDKIENIWELYAWLADQLEREKEEMIDDQLDKLEILELSALIRSLRKAAHSNQNLFYHESKVLGTFQAIEVGPMILEIDRDKVFLALRATVPTTEAEVSQLEDMLATVFISILNATDAEKKEMAQDVSGYLKMAYTFITSGEFVDEEPEHTDDLDPDLDPDVEL